MSHSALKYKEKDSPSPLRVLVVDDNDASAKTLGWMIEIMGHETKLANNGTKALEMAKEYMPDIILLDISLPGMNGYEVCEAIKREPSLNSPVLVAQTGWGQYEHRERSLKAGFDYHLVKPVAMETLEEIIDSISKRINENSKVIV